MAFKRASGRTDVDAIQVVGNNGEGSYENASPAWMYTRTWNSWAGSGPSGGMLHYTDTLGASGVFTFTGVQFVVSYTGEFNRGSFEVWVDGTKVETVNAYSPSTAWQRKYASPILSAGTHTVVVKNISGRTDIDGIQVIATPDATAPSAVGSLAGAPGTSYGAVNLSWTAPMNDAGNASSGPVYAYLVRYSLTNITSESNWNAATPVTSGIPVPGAVGASQSMTVSGLAPGLKYYFAVRGQDTGMNLGSIVTTSAIPKAPARMSAGVYDDAHSSWVYFGAGPGPKLLRDGYVS